MKPSNLERKFSLYWRAISSIQLVPEHPVKQGRRWRFDFAHPDTWTAIEIEGGQWCGGRHTRGAGFAKDCEKYNEAQFQGWTVFRLTGDMITEYNLTRIAAYIVNVGGVE